MRYVSIDLSSDNYLQQPKIFGGYAGEHNETVLQVKLPLRMVDIECSGYRFDFQTSEDNKISIFVSELNDGVLSLHLTEQLTLAGELLFNVAAILSDENSVSLISKTNTVTLYIGDSPEGNNVLLDPSGYKDEILDMIDRRIAEINPAQVDQTYSPSSPNAQSGVAVAEAIAGVSSGGDKYEHIETITTTEELYSIYRNKEPNGNSYKFSKMLFYLTIPKATANAWLTIVTCGKNSAIANGLKAASKVLDRAELMIDITAKKLIANFREDINSTGNFKQVVHETDYTYMNYIEINADGTSFPIGTKIEIYGVRA